MPPLSNLPASNNYEGMFVNALNFPPLDFNFYQKRPPISGYDNLVTPRLKGAFHFSSDNQHVVAANAQLSQNTLTELTIECWVKADENAISNCGTIWRYSDENNVLSLSDPGWLTVHFNNATISLDVSIMDGMWHHIAIVCRENDNLELYFDTVKIYFSQFYSTAMQGSGTFAVGNYGSSNTFCGLIGQVRFWNQARSHREILDNSGRYLSPVEMNNLCLYWSDEFDISALTINDSSTLRTLENQGVFNNPPATRDVWNITDYYGAIADADHLQPHPVNMSGNAKIINDFYYKNLSISRNNINIEDFNSMTAEFWLKVSPVSMSLNGAVLFELRNLNNGSILITNPDSLTISFSGNEATSFDTNFSLMDGKWHHLALSWESGVSVTFYVDSNPIHHVDNASGYTLPNEQTTEIYSLNLIRSGTGIYYSEVSEFRLYTSARTQEEVFRDASCRIAGQVEDLLIYWPFSRSMTNHTVEDFSGNSLNGSITNGIYWTNTELFGLLANGFAVAPAMSGSEDAGSPVTAWQYGQTDLTSLASGGTRVSGAVDGFPDISIDQLEQAYLNAQNHGYFDPEVFPNCYFANTSDRTEAQASIQLLNFEDFLSYWIKGRRLNFYRNFANEMVYEFIPLPKGYGPTLLLLFDTRICSFYGDIGGGQVVRTFSLMPGESTYVSMETYKKSTQQEEDTSSIFDSNNQSAQQAFQQSLNTEAGVDTDLSAALSFHLSGETKLRWGLGNLDLKGSVKASVQAKLQTHLQVVSNAMSTHSNERSSQRNVTVNTDYTVTTESGSNTAITREFKNINNGTTLNILFKQMNQQFVVQHMLTNIRVGYFDPAPGSYRTVQLSQLDDLLDQVLIDNADLKMAHKERIISAAYAAASMGIASNNTGTFLQQRTIGLGEVSNIEVNEEGLPIVHDNLEYFINPASTSSFTIAGENVSATGVVLSTDYFTMRTDNIVADLELGEYSGLDTYGEALREGAVIREEVLNDSVEVANRQTVAALTILENAKESGMSTDELGELYRQLFLVKPDILTEIYKQEPTTSAVNP